MHAHSTTHTILCFWITLLSIVALAVSTPVPEPEPAPIDPNLAAAVGSNLNLGCQNGCPAASSAQQLDKSAALDLAVRPLSVFGGIVLTSGVLAAI